MDLDCDLRNVSEKPRPPPWSVSGELSKPWGGKIFFFASDATTAPNRTATSHMLSNPDLLRTGPISYVSNTGEAGIEGVEDRTGETHTTLPAAWMLKAVSNPEVAKLIVSYQLEACRRQWMIQNANFAPRKSLASWDCNICVCSWTSPTARPRKTVSFVISVSSFSASLKHPALLHGEEHGGGGVGAPQLLDEDVEVKFLVRVERHTAAGVVTRTHLKAPVKFTFPDYMFWLDSEELASWVDKVSANINFDPSSYKILRMSIPDLHAYARRITAAVGDPVPPLRSAVEKDDGGDGYDDDGVEADFATPKRPKRAAAAAAK